MSARSLFNERFGMLMACASPGSALAYHLGTTKSEADLVRRTSTPVQAGGKAAPQPNSGKNWLSRALDRLEQWSWERQLRDDEAYLAEATDLCDLEARIRRLDGGDGLSRARVLR
jgi:uncharacterized protein DUF3563